MPPENHPGPAFRWAQPDDVADIFSLLHRNAMLSPERDGPLLSLEPGSRLVGAIGNTLVAHAHAGDRSGIPLVSGVVVDEAYRGQGIGMALMKALKEYLGQEGRRTFEVLVDLDKSSSLAWYRKNGFIPTFACVGMTIDVPRPVRTGRTVAALEVVRAACSSNRLEVYRPESVARLSEAMQAMRPGRSDTAAHAARLGVVREAGAMIAKQRQGIAVRLTPWFMSHANPGELVRWGRVDGSGSMAHLYREERAPLAERPPDNPHGAYAEPYGNYVLHDECSNRAIAFSVSDGTPPAKLLRGPRLSPVVRDLQYAARV